MTFGSRAGLVAAWIGDFAHLGTREVMDDLFSDGPLREADNGRLHRHSRWDQRTGGVGASLAYFCLFTYRDPRGEGRGGAAAATQTFRGDGLQRRRGYDVDIPAGTWPVRRRTVFGAWGWKYLVALFERVNVPKKRFRCSRLVWL